MSAIVDIPDNLEVTRKKEGKNPKCTWKCTKPIGAGAFGVIYLGENEGETSMSKGTGIKIEMEGAAGSSQLETELNIFKLMNGCKGYPTLHHYQHVAGKYRICVMDLLGVDLECLKVYYNACDRAKQKALADGKSEEEVAEIMESMNSIGAVKAADDGSVDSETRGFNNNTIGDIACQCLDMLWDLHKKGYLHRDIKPENLMIGRGQNANQIHFIDFGLAKAYIDPSTKEIIKMREDRPLTGTVRYASINAHRGLEQSRRDDLESLCYVLIYLNKGSIPWRLAESEMKNEAHAKGRTKELKIETSIDSLCEGCHPGLKAMLKLVRKLDYAEEPDYNKYKELMCQMDEVDKVDAKRFPINYHFPDWLQSAVPQGGSSDTVHVDQEFSDELVRRRTIQIADMKAEAESRKRGDVPAKTAKAKGSHGMSHSGSVHGGSVDGGGQQNALSRMARLEEKKKLLQEVNSAKFEFGLDAFDLSFKLLVVMAFLFIKDTEVVEVQNGEVITEMKSNAEVDEDYTIPLCGMLTFAMSFVAYQVVTRLSQLKEMRFIAEHGFSYKWQKGERLVSSGTGVDPRIERDAKLRQVYHQKSRAIQGIVVDLPWVCVNVIRGAMSVYGLNALGTASIAVAGFGFGMKFSNVIALLKSGVRGGGQKAMYNSLPADCRIGVGSSTIPDTEAAIEAAWENLAAEIGGRERAPTICMVFMTFNHDLELGLRKFEELSAAFSKDGKHPQYSGCTFFKAALMGTTIKKGNEDMCVGLWGLYDPEGLYTLGCIDMDGTEGSLVKQDIAGIPNPIGIREVTRVNCQNAMKKRQREINEYGVDAKTGIRTMNPVLEGKPDFVWMNAPPGPEDLILQGMLLGIGEGVDFIGGSSGDNDVTGKWKQWNSEVGIRSNSCMFVIASCSARVKGCAFTGYNATPKIGVVTECHAPRHIKTIDGKPAALVYNDWTGGHFQAECEDRSQDHLVLAKSALYPFGQSVGQDHEGDPCYRTVQPQFIVSEDLSLKLFCDVEEGAELIQMTGTRDNVTNRLANTAMHIQRSTGIPAAEFRGALVVVCVSAYIYIGDEGMSCACRKLDEALGGCNYLGVNTFGEQGSFPDGTNKHGNLMFSALVVTSRRKVLKLQNVDSEEVVFETDDKFEEIAMSGGIIGGSGQSGAAPGVPA